MAENQKMEKTVVLRIPKPNLQVVILGLIALITIFQTFQLIRINAQASSTPVKAVSPVTTGTGSSTDVPQSMVGGC